MSTNQMNPKDRDTGGLVISCLFILIAVVALWDTTHMMDADSFIFPRAIATAMLVLNLLLIGRNFLNLVGEQEEVQPGASTGRRIALIAGMLLSCVMMPYLGFLISGIITFILLILVSMYDEWTPKTKVIYPLVALSLVVGFYMLFSKLLLVPLPVGVLFE
jgi:Tripartite tricarboxylate transporter TctB family